MLQPAPVFPVGQLPSGFAPSPFATASPPPSVESSSALCAVAHAGKRHTRVRRKVCCNNRPLPPRILALPPSHAEDQERLVGHPHREDVSHFAFFLPVRPAHKEG